MRSPAPRSSGTHDRTGDAAARRRTQAHRTWRIACLVVGIAVCGNGSPARAQATAAAGLPRERAPRTYSDEELAAIWNRLAPLQADHRRYIFIEESEIVEGTELPLFRIEASRYGPLRQLERMARGDPGVSERIADLAPRLAAETEMRRRASEAFFNSRPGVARDVPQTPDLIGPFLQTVRSRR